MATSADQAFQDWYWASKANQDWYYQQTGVRLAQPDWNVLKTLTDAGLSSTDIRNLSSSTTTTTTTRTPTTTTTSPVLSPPTTSGGSTGGGGGGTTATLIDPTTGRPAYTGPLGEAGLGTAPTAAQIAQYGSFIQGMMPDGRRVWYVPGQHIQEGNLMALENWRKQTGSDDPSDEASQRSAHALLRQVLDSYGLGGLADWAWGMIQNNRSYEEVLLELRNRPEFKTRFKAIDLRRQYGLNPVSPEDIIQYENAARDLMRASGLPGGFYDQADDFAELIGKGVSLESVARRVEFVWDRVVNAPTEVRQAFGDLFGVAGDQALASMFFDPDKAEVQLEKMARSAVAGGAMRAAGFDLDAIAAARVAGFDLGDQTVRAGFARLAQLRGVFTETMGERNAEDLDPFREGINAVFDVGEGADAVERRVQTRANAFRGGGGALLTSGGLTGLRTL